MPLGCDFGFGLSGTASTGLHFDLSVRMHPMLMPSESGILVSVSYAPLGE